MFIVFLKKYKDSEIGLNECMYSDTEQHAQWYCVLNPQYTYRKINDCEVVEQ